MSVFRHKLRQHDSDELGTTEQIRFHLWYYGLRFDGGGAYWVQRAFPFQMMNDISLMAALKSLFLQIPISTLLSFCTKIS